MSFETVSAVPTRHEKNRNQDALSINNVESNLGFFSKHKGKIAGAAALGLAGLGYQHRDKLNGLWNRDVVPAPQQPTFMKKYGYLVKNGVRAAAVLRNFASKKIKHQTTLPDNVIKTDKDESTALIWESLRNHTRIVELLWKHFKINVNKPIEDRKP